MSEEQIIKKLIEHDDQFKKMDEKLDNHHREDLDRSDRIIVILERLDQERVFSNERIRRIENEVEQQAKEIKELKLRLNIA